MHLKKRNRTYIAFAIAASVVAAGAAQACTGMRVKAEDGSVTFGRTLEFGKNTQSDIVFVPRGQSWTGSTPDGQPGIRWKNTYAYMGPDAFGEPMPIEGINEKGLYIGAFFFPGEAEYQQVEPAEYSKTLSPTDFPSWVLGNCATLEDIRNSLSSIKIGGVFLKAMGMIPAAHWYAMDSTGRALTIEPIKGEIRITGNPVGVLTNAPSFDWHLTNLRSYVNLRSDNAQSQMLGGLKIVPMGQGSGMLGIPGDFTPPSRFVRAAFLANTVQPAKDADQAVNLAWNLVSNFTIPIGVTREQNAEGKVGCDYTQWATVYDLSRNSLYFRTYNNQDVSIVKLKQLPLDGKKILFIPMWNVKPSYKDVTGQAR